MKAAEFKSRSITAVVVASIASSLLVFATFMMTASFRETGTLMVPAELAVTLAIVMFWGPAFALVPAAILGFAVERPLARRLIVRSHGGFIEHLLAIVAAALALWLLLRVAVITTGPQTKIVDLESLVVFAIIGLCSAISWWFLVVLPERRA